MIGEVLFICSIVGGKTEGKETSGRREEVGVSPWKASRPLFLYDQTEPLQRLLQQPVNKDAFTGVFICIVVSTL